MKATRFVQTTLLLLSLTLLGACGEDDVVQEELLLGRWDIRQGLRNGRATESLDQLFFVFYEEGRMQTNITGSPADANYELAEDQILQRGGPMEIDYTIQSLTDSLLILTTSINNYDFRLELGRTIQEE